MTRRLLTLGLALLTCPGCFAAHAQQAPSEARQDVIGIADEYLTAFARRYPGAVSVPGAPADRLFDNSIAAYRAWWAQEDDWLKRLRRIDADTLRGSPEWVLHGVLREHIEVSVEGRACHRHLWWLDTDYPLGEPHVGDLADVARRQAVGTPAARAAALHRWSDLPRFIDGEIDNLREGVRQGYAAPRLLVERRVQELDRLLATPVERSPFLDAARRDTSNAFPGQLRQLIEERINPSLRRYRDFLAGEYRTAARENPGLVALPNGQACWRAQLRRQTTLPLEPTAIDSLARSLVRTSIAARDRVAREGYGLADGRALSARLATDSTLVFASPAEAMDSARASLGRVLPLLPRYFGRLPDSLMPAVDTASLEPGIAAMYRAATADGRPAGVVLNSRALGTILNRHNVPVIALHEGLPGHHLQTSIALKGSEAHPLVRYLGEVPAFTEGWAIYAAGTLAKEMGVVASDHLGATEANDVFAALAYVVSSGIHAHGWTTAQAVDTLRTYLAEPEAMLQETVAYLAGWPAHVLAYPMGAAEILRLRRQAEAALGPRFDVREFHDQVLEDGRIPLGMLRAKVERWIEGARR